MSSARGVNGLLACLNDLSTSTGVQLSDVHPALHRIFLYFLSMLRTGCDHPHGVKGPRI
jgi:hypothetical protein